MHLVVYVYIPRLNRFLSLLVSHWLYFNAPQQFNSNQSACIWKDSSIAKTPWHLNHNRRAGQTALDIKYSISSFNAILLQLATCIVCMYFHPLPWAKLRITIRSVPYRTLNHLTTRVLPNKYLKSSKSSSTFALSSNPLLKLFLRFVSSFFGFSIHPNILLMHIAFIGTFLFPSQIKAFSGAFFY